MTTLRAYCIDSREISMLRKLTFLMAVMAVLATAMWPERALILADDFAPYIAEAVILFAAVVFAVTHSFYSQPSALAFVRDDPTTCHITSLIRGIPDEETALYTDCAVLSANIYMNGKSSLPGKRTSKSLESESRIETGWEEISDLRSLKRLKGSLKIEVWQSERQNIVALVFRGTIPNIGSWYANFHWLTWLLPIDNQYNVLKRVLPNLLQELAAFEKDGKILIATGHSLGGGLAQHACYLSKRIARAYVFNSSPVTGWSDIPKRKRRENVAGSVIYRLYEKNEILQYFRVFMKFAYLFNPKPNANPYIVEHRCNLARAGVIRSHGIRSLATGLKSLELGESGQPD